MHILKTKVIRDGELTITEHTVLLAVSLASGDATIVKQINVIEEEDCGVQVNAIHTNEDMQFAQQLYSMYEEEFCTAISNILGYKVLFTESGMQDGGYASMERV